MTTLTEVFPCFSSVVRQMPGLNSQSRGTDRISSELSFVLCCHCVMLLSLCSSVVIMLYCYCVDLLLFVLSYVLLMCTWKQVMWSLSLVLLHHQLTDGIFSSRWTGPSALSVAQNASMHGHFYTDKNYRFITFIMYHVIAPCLMTWKLTCD